MPAMLAAVVWRNCASASALWQVLHMISMTLTAGRALLHSQTTGEPLPTPAHAPPPPGNALVRPRRYGGRLADAPMSTRALGRLRMALAGPLAALRRRRQAGARRGRRLVERLRFLDAAAAAGIEASRRSDRRRRRRLQAAARAARRWTACRGANRGQSGLVSWCNCRAWAVPSGTGLAISST